MFPPDQPPGAFSSTAQVTVGRQRGYIFHSTGQTGYCFVPADCVYPTGAGHQGVDEIRYFLSGWSVRNMRAGNLDADGDFLFPDISHPVTEVDAPAVSAFRQRIARACQLAAGSAV